MLTSAKKGANINLVSIFLHTLTKIEKSDIVKKKQFKAESKKLLDMMINSIYTNKEIFLRELISNASDAIDKLYYRSLTDKDIKVKKKDLQVKIDIDKDERIISISDNGCGMTETELEENLGTIAKSGSALFKENNEAKKDIEIIGQFGVGFYSSFMVSDTVEVLSKSVDSEKAYKWTSNGVDGYTIEPTEKTEIGTTIKLHIKANTETEEYDEFLNPYKIEELVKKYSDYIHYPIVMLKKEDDKEDYQTLNSMIPIWKKKQKDVKDEEYNDFYADKFYDYEPPLKVIRSEVEGQTTYQALLFIPSHAPFDYYTKEYEKGLKLYTKGVLIQEKCSELLPDYFSFVKGIVDSEDLSLNISRETLQQDHQVKLIAKSLETKISKELQALLKEDRENYEKFFEAFGTGLKYGIYTSYGMNKDKLQDLLLFKSSNEHKYVTLKEYVDNLKENQDSIYYACGETVDKIDLLPQVEAVKEKGYEILYLTDYVDEFTLKSLQNYEEKNFVNVSDESLDLDTEEEKQELKKENEENQDLLKTIKEKLNINEVKFSNRLKNHPVCLTTTKDMSIEMQKVLNSMPNAENIEAKTTMEINANHPIAKKLKDLYKKKNSEELEKYAKVLYSQARLIEGLTLDNPTEISNLVCELLAEK